MTLTQALTLTLTLTQAGCTYLHSPLSEMNAPSKRHGVSHRTPTPTPTLTLTLTLTLALTPAPSPTPTPDQARRLTHRSRGVLRPRSWLHGGQARDTVP